MVFAHDELRDGLLCEAHDAAVSRHVRMKLTLE